MFIAEKLVYLALPKTGSTQIHAVLAETVGGAHLRYPHYHATLPDEDLPWHVVGSVRNPWDWYVSWWAWQCELLDPPSVFSAKGSSRLVRSPLTTLRHRAWRTADADDIPAFRRWLTAGRDIGSPRVPKGAWMTRQFLKLYARGFTRAPEEVPTDVEGFYRERRIPADFIRQEHLEADLLRILTEVGYTLTDVQRAAIHRPTRMNTSEHAPAAAYYDDETVAHVAGRDAFIISEFGYQPPG